MNQSHIKSKTAPLVLCFLLTLPSFSFTLDCQQLQETIKFQPMSMVSRTISSPPATSSNLLKKTKINTGPTQTKNKIVEKTLESETNAPQLKLDRIENKIKLQLAEKEKLLNQLEKQIKYSLVKNKHSIENKISSTLESKLSATEDRIKKYFKKKIENLEKQLASLKNNKLQSMNHSTNKKVIIIDKDIQDEVAAQLASQQLDDFDYNDDFDDEY